MEGILPVYKPAGITSYDVIREFKHKVLKNIPGKTKIGHGGTLDPFADGVLLLLLGRATKRMNELQSLPKTYRAKAVLAAESDTLDSTGQIHRTGDDNSLVDSARFTAAATRWEGSYSQTVPVYSAAKYQGKPLYKYAREGVETPAKQKMVTIYAMNILQIEKAKTLSARGETMNDRPTVEFSATCSSGTYIRQLSYDFFESLGIKSYLASLTRTAIGPYAAEKAAKLTSFETEAWRRYLVPTDK